MEENNEKDLNHNEQPDGDLTRRIRQLLETDGVEHTFMRHEPTRTSEDSARVRGTSLEQGAKAMIFEADGKLALLVLQASKRIDTRRFKTTFGVKNLRLVSPEEVKNLTGLEVGAVPPFGKLMSMQTYVDDKLLEQPVISFNAGSRTASIIMSSAEYVRLEQPVISQFIQS